MLSSEEKAHLKLFILYIFVSMAVFAGLTILHSYITFSQINSQHFVIPMTTAVLVGFLMARNRILRIQLTQLANTDKLTGICNRQYFDRRLGEEIDRAKRYQHFFSIIYLDLDHFKAINDHYGHATGDQVLIEFAQVIKGVNRESDLFARFGGEEFILLLQMTDSDSARILYQRIRDAVDQYPFSTISSLTFSAGITEFDPQYDDQASLLDRADNALYQAKHNGRNQAVISKPTPA